MGSLLRRLGQLLRRLLASLLPQRWRQRLLLRRLYGADHRRLLAAQADAAAAQRATLAEILTDNRDTEFGRSHDFRQIVGGQSGGGQSGGGQAADGAGVDEARYRANVPLRRYEQLAPLLARQCQGEPDVLVAGPPRGVIRDRSAGRERGYPLGERALAHLSSAERLVRRVAVTRQPQVGGGAWLELLPVTPAGADAASLPWLVGNTWPAADRAMPGGICTVPEVFSVLDEQARYYLLLRLALIEPVAALRAWAPGTLAILAQHLEQLGPHLVEDIGAGRLTHRDQLGELSATSSTRIERAERPDAARAQALARLLDDPGYLAPAQAWPALRLLVCPTTGAARSAADRLPDRFGDLPVLDPGHLLPMAPLSGPLEGDDGGPLALGGQYWEFLPVDDPRPEPGATPSRDGEPLPLAELVVGARYQPALTNAGGLYRCLLDQVVEVVEAGHGGSAPRLAPVALGSCSVRPTRDDAMIDGQAVAEAVAEASRQAEIGVTGQTAWFGPSYLLAHAGEDPERAASAAEDEGKAGWLRRLLRSWTRDRAADAGRTALNLVLEPVATLDEGVCRKLLGAVDRALGERSAAYRAGREREGGLGQPRALLLRRGTFARQARQRVALGLPSAHVAPPPLLEQPPDLDEEAIAGHVDG